MDVIRCPDCGGKGFKMPEGTPMSIETERIPCGRCVGGLAPAKVCPKCKGDPYGICKECGSLYLKCKECNGQGKVPA